MSERARYFFCGIGGSGMLPLALTVAARGAEVAGSDRGRDQGRDAAKFAHLDERGVALFPQDGSGLTSPEQVLVASAAVEDTVPDVAAAARLGVRRVTRAELLAELLNAAPVSIGVAGTSGKSTTTAMIAWILHRAGVDPTVVNGAVMPNFVTPEAPFASAIAGAGPIFAAEVDESDGSIALFSPTIAVLNNIAPDHMAMDRLRTLFSDFIAKGAHAVLNLDNTETAALANNRSGDGLWTYTLTDAPARLRAYDLAFEPEAVSATIAGAELPATRLRLNVPGAHNVSNALAALSACAAAGVALDVGVAALETFQGARRRLETVGTANGVTVIDDFAHNPDKIAASLATLHAFPGRVIVIFQPQGYGPLRLLKDAFIAMFASALAPDDVLLMPEPVYFGGTTDRSVSTPDIIDGVRAAGRRAEGFADRDACAARALELAEPGDRVVVMGARDDSLTAFARDLLAAL